MLSQKQKRKETVVMWPGGGVSEGCGGHHFAICKCNKSPRGSPILTECVCQLYLNKAGKKETK